MATPDFFNENLHRTFPFKRLSAGVGVPDSGPVTLRQLPDDFVVDCGFIVGANSGFVSGVHSVYLDSITKVNGTDYIFEFRCNAPGLVNVPLRFNRSASSPDYLTSFVDSDGYPTDASASDSADNPCAEFLWSGYLTTGRMASVVDRMSMVTVIFRVNDLETVVEPALIQNLANSQLLSLNVANADRTRAVRPDNCPQNSWPFAVDQIYIVDKCIQGDIRFKAGYNLTVSQNDSTNTIQISPAIGAGLGEPCEQIPLFPGETPPIGATNNLLAGDFYCNEVLRTVNGLGGPNLSIFAGNGVSIVPDVENHTLIVDINLSDMSLCTYSEVSE